MLLFFTLSTLFTLSGQPTGQPTRQPTSRGNCKGPGQADCWMAPQKRFHVPPCRARERWWTLALRGSARQSYLV